MTIRAITCVAWAATASPVVEPIDGVWRWTYWDGSVWMKPS